MPIAVRCPDCGVKSQYPDRYAGETVACKSCGSDVDVPSGGGRSGGGKKSGKRKSASSSNAGLIVAGIAGFALVGLIAVAGLAFWVLGRARGPAAPQHVAQSPGAPAEPAGAGAAATPNAANSTAVPGTAAATASRATPSMPTPSGFQAAAATSDRLTFAKPSVWELAPDPPTEAVALASTKPLKLKLDRQKLRDDALLYPVTLSPFMALKVGTGSREPLEIYNLTNGQKTGTAVPGNSSNAFALSPDGKLFASCGYSSGINVFDVKAKKPLGELATAGPDGQFRVTKLGIPTPTRLVAISQLEKGIKVWELPSGNFVSHIVGGNNFHAYAGHAYSPGGHYIAVNAEFLEKRIEIYDLDSGKLAATIALEGKNSAALAGFAFSADGTEFAALYDVTRYGAERSYSQFVVWNLESGQVTSDFDVEPTVKEQLDPPYGKERLESFPNGRRWLVHSLGIIDRDQQQLIYSFPKQDGVTLDVALRVMGDDWLVGVMSDKADARLETITIDEELLASAAKSAAAGGLAMDGGLPTLTACDYKSAPTATASTSWTVTPDPAPVPDAWNGPIVVEAGSGVVGDLAISRSTSPIIAARIAYDADLKDSSISTYESATPQTRRLMRWRHVNPVAQKTNLDAFSAVTGERVSRLELPFSGDLLSVSPNGELALVMLHRGEGRLDVFSIVADGKHVVGWRPYRNAEKETHRELFDASFVDDEHVATMNTNGEVVVWKLEDMSPVFVVPEANRFLVSPGGGTLAVVRGNSTEDKDIAFFDSRSGDGKGIITVDTIVSAIAFHPNGKWLAMSHGSETNRYVSTMDLADGRVDARFPVPDMSTQLQWTGDDFLLLGGSQLVSKTLQAVVWSYNSGPAVFPEHPAGGMCAFALPSGNRWQLRSVELPHPEAAKKLDGAELAALALVKPGDTVSLNVSVGNESELSKLKENAADEARKRLETAQLTVADAKSPVEVQFKITFKTGDTAQLTSMGIGDRTEQTVTRKMINFEIAYRMGQKTIWETRRVVSNLDGYIFRLQPGESAQQGIDRKMLETTESYISKLELPTYVFGDKARAGLGSSTLASVK